MSEPVSRSNLVLSVAAWLITVTGIMLMLAVDGDRLVSLIRLFCVTGALVQLVAIAIGSGPLVGASLGPLLVAGALSAAAADSSPRLAALVVGCLWFVGAEAAWEAIDRRDGVARARSATLARLRDVGVVSLVAFGVGVTATMGSAAPPVRSLPLQVLVGLIFFVAAVVVSRRIRSDSDQPATR